MLCVCCGDAQRRRKRALTDVFVHTQHGRMPLHYACDNGHTEVVKVLLQSGADVEAKNEVSAESIGVVAVIGMCGEKTALYLVRERGV